MKEVAAQGRIVIMVSHALTSMVEMCDRCLWLDDGRLVMDGPSAKVAEAYRAAVEQADEAELKAKFDAGEPVVRRANAGALGAITLAQRNEPIATTARAFVPLTIEVTGDLVAPTGDVDLEVSIVRVDGRPMLRRRFSETGSRLPSSGPIQLCLDLDPLIFGADLYRADVTLLDAEGPIDTKRRVVQVVDEEGQFGGKPLLYHPPVITARPAREAAP
jgi:lipopolysaccharide transport system ATP-binding protein